MQMKYQCRGRYVPDIWDSLMQYNASVLFQAFHHESRMLYRKFLKGDTTLVEKRAVGHFLVDIGAVNLEVKTQRKKKGSKDSWDTVEVHYNRSYPQSTPHATDIPRHRTDVRGKQEIAKQTEDREVADAPDQVASVAVPETKREPTQDISKEDLSWTAGDVNDDSMAVDDDDDDDDGDDNVSSSIDTVDDLNGVGQNKPLGNDPPQENSSKVQIKTDKPASIIMYKCTICRSVFQTMWELDLHTTVCQSSADLYYNCHLCRRSYKIRRSVSTHLHQDHNMSIADVLEKVPSLRGPRREPLFRRGPDLRGRHDGKGSGGKSRSLLKRTKDGKFFVGKSIFDGTQKSDRETRYLNRKRIKTENVSADEEMRGDASSSESKEGDGITTSTEHGTESASKNEEASSAPHHVMVGQKDLEGDDQESLEKEKHDAEATGSSTDIVDSQGQNESSLPAVGSCEEGADEGHSEDQVITVAEGGDATDIDATFQKAHPDQNDSNSEGQISPHDPVDKPDKSVAVEAAEENRESVVEEEGLSQHSSAESQPCEQSGTESKKKRGEETKEKPSSWPCQLCGSSFKTQYKRQVHIDRTHFNENYRCNTCGKVYVNVGPFREHVKSHGRPSKPKFMEEFVCRFCSKAFKHRGFYRRHLEEHEADSNFPDFICKYCNVKLGSKGSLVKHVNSRHTKEKKFPCTFCDKIFYIKHQFNSHMKGHIEGKKWKCDVCDAAYVEKWSMEMHKKNVHQNTQFFLCDLCGTTYKSMGNLRQHNLTAHSDDFKFSCDICGKKFKRKTHMNAHMKVHLNLRPHKCNLCEKAFRTRTNLNVHLKWHNNERSFKCEVCEMCFLTKGNLDKHMQKHRETKAHFCTECGYGCTDFTMLRKHLATTHNIVIESILTKSEGMNYRRGGNNAGIKNTANSRKKGAVEEKVEVDRTSAISEDDQATASICVIPVVSGPHYPPTESMTSIPVATYTGTPSGHHFPSNEAMNSFANVPASSMPNVPGSGVPNVSASGIANVTVSGTPGVAANYTYPREMPTPTCDEEGQAIATQAFMNMILH